MRSIYDLVSEMQKKGEKGALCTIVNSSGSIPRHDASKMIVYENSSIFGSVGGGETEYRVIQEALQAIGEEKARFLEYKLVNPAEGDPGICGGTVKIFIEPILPQPLIVVIGAGHVGKAVIHLASWLGFRTYVSDDRKEFCNPEAVPGADGYYPVNISDLPTSFTVTSQTYFILTTRGLNIDVEGVPALLDTPAPYIGIIGSKRRWIFAKKKMLAMGVPEEKLKRVHSPIGLELGAETPEEIAVSILSEVLIVKNQVSGKTMKLV
jgi:xanthine dehydrogenase accessory factor